MQIVFETIPGLLGDRDRPLPNSFLEHLACIFQSMQTHAGRRASRDARRAQDFLGELEGKTITQAIELAKSVGPARHPRIAAGPRIYHGRNRIGRQRLDQKVKMSSRADCG
jgi:hypothetical protein